MKLRIASRGSALARWQAEHVRDRLRAAHADVEAEIRFVRTTGDRIRDVPLARIGDQGLFTKEVDRFVLDGSADLAVHSLKDMPTRLADGLALAAVLAREDARDAYLPAPGRPASPEELPAGARIGTSSLRRRAQLLHERPDLRVADLRGNLDTRLERLSDGDYDGIVLALAGLRRLGAEDRIGTVLDPPGWLPAAGQGALAIVTRKDDNETGARLSALEDGPTRAATTAERAFLRALEGGCQIPIGALAENEDGALRLYGFVASLDGRDVLRGEAGGHTADPERLGIGLARRLLDRGAGEILARVRGQAPDDLPSASAP